MEERRSRLRAHPDSTWAYGIRDIGTTYRKYYIKFARGWLLDGLGVFFKIQRLPKEDDNSYRARILENYDKRRINLQ